jgi:hypothetical protein
MPATREPQAKDLSPKDLARGLEAVEENAAIATERDKLTRDALVKEFGEENYRERADGSWTVSAYGRRGKGKAFEMTDECRKRSIARGHKIEAQMAERKIRVRRTDGSITTIDSRYEGLVAAQGVIKPFVRYGGVRCVRGPDGLMYREISGGRFECTGKRQVGILADVVAPDRVGHLIELGD